MRITVEGELGLGVTAKDLILALIGEIGTAGGTGHVIEYAGAAIRQLSMEGRMTVCNMSIEAGARAGLIAPDDTTFDYLKGRPQAPQGEAWEQAVADWRTLPTDAGARYDHEVALDGGDIEPQVTWGTSPRTWCRSTAACPIRPTPSTTSAAPPWRAASPTWASPPGTPMTDVRIDHVFIGSCTNSRIEDLRAAAAIVQGRKVAGHVQAMVVPGSGLSSSRPSRKVSTASSSEAGFEWREAGCWMCLAMNDDRLKPGERCASTSNRNFEGRQGRGGRTHLVSPAMAAAAAVSRPFRRCPRVHA